MKKRNLLQLLLVAIATIGMFSCNSNHKCKCEHDDWESQIPEGTFCYADEGRTKEMLNYTEIVNMLRTYDTTRIAPLKKALGYVDSRINTYNYQQFKKYLGRIENLSKKAKIKITGISFIAAAKPNYNNTGKSYQDLIYIPTTTIKGKQVAFDPVQSVKEGKLVTFKQTLAANGYRWIYSTKEDIKKYSDSICVKMKNHTVKRTLQSSELSGAGNWGELIPPHTN